MQKQALTAFCLLIAATTVCMSCTSQSNARPAAISLVEYVQTPRNDLSATEILKQPFKRAHSRHPNFGFTTQNVWLRLVLSAPIKGKYILDIARDNVVT